MVREELGEGVMVVFVWGTVEGWNVFGDVDSGEVVVCLVDC